MDKAATLGKNLVTVPFHLPSSSLIQRFRETGYFEWFLSRIVEMTGGRGAATALGASPTYRQHRAV
jgi:hypothetical protein